MADKKKMSVAEMLAAARKVDGGAAGAEPAEAAPAAEESASASGLPSMELPADSAEVVPASSPESAAKPKPATGAGGARPSVAEMMAMARAKSGAAQAAPGAKAPAEKAAAAPKPKPAAGAAKPAAAAASPAAPRDSASILAAARKKDRPGPMTKAEAAAKADASAVVAKPKVVAPPMPPKPDYAKPKPAVTVAAKGAADENRRDFFGVSLAVGFWALGAVSAFWTLLSVKFMFPNVLREPPSKFKVGPPDAFAPGQVQEKFKAQYGIWVVNAEYNGQQQIVALKSVCTHLGCTPNWLEAEQKYKCPCHGSGFYKDGINFEGPAPRPLERYAIRLADDGQIEVDKSRTFQEEMGAWSDPSCFIPV